MTIQNIEDVMERILNLNKNLTEESLRTLLAASGWDKEDVMEGIHIFRSTRGNLSPATPIQNTEKFNTYNNTVNVSVSDQDIAQENDYTFDITPRPTQINNTLNVEAVPDTSSDNLNIENTIFIQIQSTK